MREATGTPAEASPPEPRSRHNPHLLSDEWQHTLDCIPDLIAILDTEHRIVKANRAMREKLEQGGDSIIDQHCYRLMYNLDAPPDFCPHTQLLKDGNSHSVEVYLPVLDGHYSITVTPLHDAVGNLTGSIHIAHDITKRKLTEEALRESEALLREAQEIAGLGTYHLDMKTGTWSSSVILDSIFGIDETFDRSVSGWVALIHSGDQVRMKRYFMEEVLKNCQRFDREYRIIRVDIGTERWVHGVGRLEFDEQGRPVRMIGTIMDITERKLMEQKLLNASEEWRKTFDSIPDLITLLDNEHRIVRANRAVSQKLGCDVRDLIGTPCYSLFHGSDSPPDICPHAKSMQSGLTHSADVFEPKQDGYLSVTVTPLRDAHGNVTGSIHVAHDITELKRVEAALRESESLFRSIIAATPDDITVAELDGRIRMVSGNGAAMFGYEREELMLGRHIMEFLVPADRERAQADIVLMFQGVFSGPGQYRALRSDGSQIEIEVNGNFIRDSDDRPTSMVFAIRDIAARKKIEKELRFKTTILETQQQNALDGILVVDETQTIISCNRRFIEIFDIPPRLIEAGYDVPVLKHVTEQTADPDGFLSRVEYLYNHTEEKSREGILLANGGVIDRYSAPMKGVDGSYFGRVWYFRDISERKLVEAELSRKNAEIEQFIYTVSHDLRSPLVTVKTFLGYLEQDISSGDRERAAKDMEFMHTAADRMVALLNELLDMSRIGRAHTANDSVGFHELVSEALDALAGQIVTGRVDVRTSADDLPLCGDRRRLLQIWQNLLDNALKYMGAQEVPRIEVGVEQQGEETVFFVRDNGVGIAPEHHGKVFGIFEKLDRTTGGVGMGLAMVKRIVEMYGGEIRVESEGIGSGSCFRFTLPAALPSPGSTQPA
jgi:PAS domain S-box-containing protein